MEIQIIKILLQMVQLSIVIAHFCYRGKFTAFFTNFGKQAK